MNLYLLERWPKGSAEFGDCEVFVVAAATAGDARQLAAKAHGDEDAHTWRDPDRSTCKALTHPRTPGVIARQVKS